MGVTNRGPIVAGSGWQSFCRRSHSSGRRRHSRCAEQRRSCSFPDERVAGGRNPPNGVSKAGQRHPLPHVANVEFLSCCCPVTVYLGSAPDAVGLQQGPRVPGVQRLRCWLVFQAIFALGDGQDVGGPVQFCRLQAKEAVSQRTSIGPGSPQAICWDQPEI